MATRKWGNEILVNTTLTGSQDQPSVTGLTDGGFVVTWRDDGPAETRIRWQRYDAAGVKLGAEVTLDTDLAGGNQFSPDVVQLSDGNLWFAVQDFDSSIDSDIDGFVYSLAGIKLGIRAPQTTSVDHESPAIASLGANGSVAVFFAPNDNGGDIRMTIFNAAGTTILDTAPVNTNAGSLAAQQSDPAVAASADGTKFVVTWRDSGLDISDIRARVFDNAGIAIGAEFTVNSFSGNSETDPKVVWLNNDRFVTTWTDNGGVGNDVDGSGGAVKFIIRNAAGTPVGTEQLANTTTFAHQRDPDITALPNGGFVIAWEDSSETGVDQTGTAIRLQAFDALGNKTGGEILVNTTTADFQFSPSIAALADGRVVVSWRDDSLLVTQGTDIRTQIIDPRDGIIDGTEGADKLYGHDSVGDVISAGDGADTVYGLAGADTIYGSDGADQLFGGRGDDTMYGGTGVDSLVGGLGADDMDGGNGNDTAHYRASRVGVTVNLATGFGFGGDAEGDTLVSMETIFGSDFDDVLTASNSAATFFGFVGADTLTGGIDADSLSGGLGGDILNGAGGIDTASYTGSSVAVTINLTNNALNAGGEAAGDQLSNIENIQGSGQGDNITGDSQNNKLTGNNGGDTLNGGTGLDVLVGGLGVDTLIGGANSDSFVYAIGGTGQTAATADIVADYAKGLVGVGDEFDFTSVLTVGGVAGVAGVNQASINASTGVATFAALSGTTMADALADIATSINQGTTTAGEFAFFKVNQTGNFHLFISDGVAGVGANDVLVQLTNITTINTINLMAGDLTILT